MYFVDLEQQFKNLSVDRLPESARAFYLANKKMIDSYGGYDELHFTDEAKAHEFLDQYKKAYKSLSKKKSNVPKMLYKRRYMVLSKMGIKRSTVRDYNKNWKVGQVFELYDQTYFLQVKLTSMKKNKDKTFTYYFELI